MIQLSYLSGDYCSYLNTDMHVSNFESSQSEETESTQMVPQKCVAKL